MRILITAGATREYIDPVRFISNASSGRMGDALARAALKAGHKVTLITTVGNSKFQISNSKLKAVKVETAAQMFRAVKRYFHRCDCLIMTAAVADYTPVRPAKTKIKKGSKSITIKLKPTVDILKWAGKHKNPKSEIRGPKFRLRRLVVGFALEDRNVQANAERKLRDKNLDMIIANTPAAIGADEISVRIKTPDRKWQKLPKASKAAVAKKIVSLVEGI
ncbi:MAG: phosphopantothenoylcysteine decarboxylase [Planctomycetota bacterium]|nr:phosphopantothenoylcysteine decarboxylase [Planctomycetota bacterium]